MLSSPKITVLMPVYNCALYINEAVDSILNQTYSDFEFLIIDDASTDSTVSIIKGYDDPRIQLIQKPINTGLTNSLNYGLDIAKGEYIARMDGDDISLPERFAKQVAFMEANKKVVACGTLYKIIGTDKICNHPKDHEAIKVKLITGCYIAHPTVMMRRKFIKANNIQYDVQMEPAEDYDLWSKLVFIGQLANLDEVLLNYRVHQNQISILQSNKQALASNRVRLRMLQKLIISLTNDDLSFDLSTLLLRNQSMYCLVKNRIKLLNELEFENRNKRIYEVDLFKFFIKEEKQNLAKYFYENKGKISLKNRVDLFFNDVQFFEFLGIKRSLMLFFRK